MLLDKLRSPAHFHENEKVQRYITIHFCTGRTHGRTQIISKYSIIVKISVVNIINKHANCQRTHRSVLKRRSSSIPLPAKHYSTLTVHRNRSKPFYSGRLKFPMVFYYYINRQRTPWKPDFICCMLRDFKIFRICELNADLAVTI